MMGLIKKTGLLIGCIFIIAGTAARADVFEVRNTNPTGQYSLKAAIDSANSVFNLFQHDTIVFDIPNSNKVHVIKPDTALPCLTDPAGVLIDGYTQPGAQPNTNSVHDGVNAQPKIMLYNDSTWAPGICIKSSYNEIRGLIIYNFGDASVSPSTSNIGILIDGASSIAKLNKIAGCFIGVDSSGQVGNNKQDVGITVLGPEAKYNFIGDTFNMARNLIANNQLYGIALQNADSNVIVGNYVGVDRTGRQGIFTQSMGGIGQNEGVYLNQSAHNLIGGNTTKHTNLISGNYLNGLSLLSSDSNVVGMNIIGLDRDATAEVDSQKRGFLLNGSSYNQVGMPGFTNLVGGNEQIGIQVLGGSVGANFNVISSNVIGTDTSGTLNLKNGKGGVVVYSGSSVAIGNFIGGPSRWDGNVIANHDSVGVLIVGDSTNSPSKAASNRISHNSIYDNKNGIVLADSGNYQHSSPVITNVQNHFNKFADVQGTGQAGDTIEVFLSFNDQGFRFLREAVVDGAGSWSVNKVPVLPDMNITATATDASNNTSEFSAPFSLPADTISGQVFDPGSNPVTKGIVIALGIDTLRKQWRFADFDSTLGAAGEYQVEVPGGKYVLLAIADTQQYPQLMPTYYKGAARWLHAEVLSFNKDTPGVDINVRKKPPLTNGNGWIKGRIVEGPNYSGNKRTEGDPLSNINCVLIDKQTGQPKQNLSSDSVGIFHFKDLPQGKYHIHADVPGIPVDTTGLNNFDISQQGTLYDSVEVVVDSTIIDVTAKDTVEQTDTTGMKPLPQPGIDFVQVYPNPAVKNTYLYINNISTERQVIRVRIINELGQQFYQSGEKHLRPGLNKLPLKLGDFPEGMLIIRVRFEGQNRPAVDRTLLHLK